VAVKSGRTIVAATLVAFLGASSSAQKTRSFQNIDLVDVDVVVTDGDGRPVTGLTKEDFDIREDGKPVALQTFVARTAAEADDDAGRTMVILMDDVTMPRESANAVKAIATYLALQARQTDDLSVIRFRELEDEPFGDRELALTRISEYQGALVRYAPAGSPEDVLKLVASVARKLEPTGRRRKILVCIGSPRICSVNQLNQFGGGSFYDDWVDAVGAAARANLSVYSLLAVPARVSDEGIVAVTGGTVFLGASDFRPILDRIWQDAGHHYLLGYWPPASSKDLHAISVKVARKGVHVLARRLRGN
jgi:Ca-activated chloride channel family protein